MAKFKVSIDGRKFFHTDRGLSYKKASLKYPIGKPPPNAVTLHFSPDRNGTLFILVGIGDFHYPWEALPTKRKGKVDSRKKRS